MDAPQWPPKHRPSPHSAQAIELAFQAVIGDSGRPPTHSSEPGTYHSGTPARCLLVRAPIGRRGRRGARTRAPGRDPIGNQQAGTNTRPDPVAAAQDPALTPGRRALRATGPSSARQHSPRGELGRQAPNVRQPPGLIGELLDADVDVRERAPNPVVMQVPVGVGRRRSHHDRSQTATAQRAGGPCRPRNGTADRRTSTRRRRPSADRPRLQTGCPRSASCPHPPHHAFDGSSSSCRAAGKSPLGRRRRRAAPGGDYTEAA